MTYLNFTYTNTTDSVDPITALNNNWDLIDNKFTALNSGASPVGTGVTNPEQGQEFVKSSAPADISVWTGTAFKSTSNIETWGAWTTINLESGFNPVTGKTPQLRISNLGKVECRGAVQYQTGTTAWPVSYQLVNVNQFDANVYNPQQPCVKNLTATPLTGSNWCYGQIFVGVDLGFLNLFLLYQGSIAASGNYISLDSANWYAG